MDFCCGEAMWRRRVIVARTLAAKLKSEQESNRNYQRQAKRRPGGPREAGSAARNGRIWALIGPGADRRHHPVPESRHGLDVSGLLGVVSQQTAERCHRLVDRVRRHDNLRPNLVEQLVDAHHLAGVLGQADQQPHRPHLYPGGLSIS